MKFKIGDRVLSKTHTFGTCWGDEGYVVGFRTSAYNAKTEYVRVLLDHHRGLPYPGVCPRGCAGGDASAEGRVGDFAPNSLVLITEMPGISYDD